MQRSISEARRKINDAFARSVSKRLERLDMATRLSVKKIGRHRIVDESGNDLGDVDVLAAHPASRSVVAVETKDFEIARTPAEIAHELEKLFLGSRSKSPTIDLHRRRVEWLHDHLDDVLLSFELENSDGPWQVIGAVVTSDPLITPLVSSSTMPVIPYDDLDLKTLSLTPAQVKGPSKSPVKRSTARRRKRR